jgi:excisionase family DNA binding protein
MPGRKTPGWRKQDMQSAHQVERSFTVSETAQRLQIRLESVYRLIYAGLLGGERTDGKWKLSAESVENYAAKHSRKEAVREANNG